MDSSKAAIRTVLAAASALLLFPGGAAQGGPPLKATTVAYAKGTITSVAQDATHVGWITTGDPSGCGTVVRIRDLIAKTQAAVTTKAGSSCSNEEPDDPIRASRSLALFGAGEGIWIWSEYGNDSYHHLVHGKVGQSDKEFDQLTWSSSAAEYGLRTAGAGSTALIGWF